MWFESFPNITPFYFSVDPNMISTFSTFNGEVRTLMCVLAPSSLIKVKWVYRAFQKFVPIITCILRKAFLMLLYANSNLFRYEIYLNNRSKKFQTKIWRNYNIFEVLPQMCTYASFFPPYVPCPFCRFSIFVFWPFSLKCPSPKILYFLIWNYTLLK